jgi:hypothetical protein
MRVEWIKFLDETKFDDVHYFGSDDITDDVWKLFRKTRPITAHMLEEMFGITKAQEYAIDLDESFTEKKAVRMLGYTYRPKSTYSSRKKGRISNILNSGNKD